MKKIAIFLSVLSLACSAMLLVFYFFVFSELNSFERLSSEKQIFLNEFYAEFTDGQYDSIWHPTRNAASKIGAVYDSLVWVRTEVDFANSSKAVLDLQTRPEIVYEHFQIGNGVVARIPGQDGFYLITARHVWEASAFPMEDIGKCERAGVIPWFRAETRRYLIAGDKSFLLDPQIFYGDEQYDYLCVKLPEEIVGGISVFPFALGKGGDLIRGNAVIVVSRPAQRRGVNARPGFVVNLGDYDLDRATFPEKKLKEAEHAGVDLGETSQEFFFQIAAPVFPGDSGGFVMAIRDGRPELVGIVSAVPRYAPSVPLMPGVAIDRVAWGLCRVVNIDIVLKNLK